MSCVNSDKRSYYIYSTGIFLEEENNIIKINNICRNIFSIIIIYINKTTTGIYGGTDYGGMLTRKINKLCNLKCILVKFYDKNCLEIYKILTEAVTWYTFIINIIILVYN